MPFATRSLHNAESKSGNLIGLFQVNVNSRIKVTFSNFLFDIYNITELRYDHKIIYIIKNK